MVAARKKCGAQRLVASAKRCRLIYFPRPALSPENASSMSRIEKGSQRFRPTVVTRRPGADGAVRGSAAGTRRDGAASVPQAQATPGASSSARTYAFAPTQAAAPAPPARTPVRPRGEPHTETVPAAEAATPAPAEHVPGADDGRRRARAAIVPTRRSTARESEELPAAGAEAAPSPSEAPVKADVAAAAPESADAPRTITREGGRRRAVTSISDDEAEYNEQCAREPQSGEGVLPPLRVDIGATRMESIAVTNWKSGRASSRTFELERVRARQLKRRRHDAGADESRAGSADPAIKSSGTPGPSEAPADEVGAAQDPAPGDGEDQNAFGENRFAVQTRIVDGKIVLDEQSLYANYRDDEQQEQEQRNWEVVDEREGDQFVNSASRSKQRRTQRWSEEETERFFQAISQWGTDFEMITRLFPRRTRREIKSKWTKESRQNAKRLDEAFGRRMAVDLTAYGNAAGVDLSGPPPTIVPKSTPDTRAGEEANAP